VKIVLSFFAAVLLIASIGCDQPNSSSSQKADAKEQCVSPDNPYDETEEGHFKGYEWAQQNGESCDGARSESFQEGCEEYHRQVDEYDACIRRNKGNQ
jgi:hypothetical protein